MYQNKHHGRGFHCWYGKAALWVAFFISIGAKMPHPKVRALLPVGCT